MFATGNYATVWEVEDKGNYSEVALSTSRKNQKTGEYETDFSSNFVRFIGTAHTMASELKKQDKIKIGNCGVTNSYNKETKKSYINFCVFSFETTDNNAPKNAKGNANKEKVVKTKSKTKVEEPVGDEDEELPF